MKKEIYERIIDNISDNYDSDYFFAYNIEKDDVYPYSTIFDEDYDEEVCIPIPRTSSKEAFELMRSYVEDKLNPRLSFQFEEALSMNRPFSRFNDLLHKHHKENEFNNYRRGKHKLLADAWLDDYNLSIDNDVKLDFPDWQAKFKSQILQRGLEYYKDGKVSYAKVFDDIIKAKVFNYDILISYKNNKIMSLHCNCPCDFNCKHEAATMYYVTNEDSKKLKSSSNENKRINVDSKFIMNNYNYLIKQEDDTLLSYLKSYFESDADNKYEFLNIFSSNVIYFDDYHPSTRNEIVEYLIDIAFKMDDIDTLIFILKTSSIEDFKSKIIEILDKNYATDERVKALLKEEEFIKDYLSF